MVLEQAMAGHYGGTEPLAATLAALRAASRDREHPTPEDLAPIGEFHVRGRAGDLASTTCCRGRAARSSTRPLWAREAGSSFLVTPAELRVLLEGAGFEILSWQDRSGPAHAWLATQRRKLREAGPLPLGLATLLGPDFAAMARNQARNLEDGRVVPTEVICRRR